MGCWQEQPTGIPAPKGWLGGLWQASSSFETQVRGACGCSRKPPSELCVVSLEPLLSWGCAVPTQVLQGRVSCVSNEAQSLPRPHVSGKPSQSPAFQAQVWDWHSGHLGLRRWGSWGSGYSHLCPSGDFAHSRGIVSSGKSQEAMDVASGREGSRLTARHAESIF